jgi:ubiquinone/menaquinone biosynthesis C-methylase UbiE
VSDRYVPAAGRGIFTPLYDTVNAVAMRQGQWRPRLVERALGAGASPRILDLGCGTGEMALAIAHASPDVKLIGVDGDADVLERAAAKAQAAGVELELHEALADRVPLADASVDCVVSTLMFHHLGPSAKRAALAEARRVLVPGGRLLICDIGRAGDPVMRAAFFAVQLLDGFPNTRAHARGELPKIVLRAGFSDVTVFGRYRTGGGTLELIEASRAISRQVLGVMPSKTRV